MSICNKKVFIKYKTILLIQDIVRGEELLVWYGASYTMYMGLPHSVAAMTPSCRNRAKPKSAIFSLKLNENEFKTVNSL